MHFLSYIEPSMQLYNHLYNHKLAIATVFKRVFRFDLGRDVFITQWMAGWKKELALQPRHDPDEAGWDVGFNSSVLVYSIE